ncbi:hypothetical protein AJ79_05893 [Helicocarpus griseus UAMH5409]|uniref:C3H1-type domain-containing protein n=1 Tax=Helicocarpus griseus UAMH5409 TaxID=1447875 RepID=A0A2B7XAX0_9EURO|nr:hypothetical protein AJ79_05893 [Helicocarpus griseus UAMH5409]
MDPSSNPNPGPASEPAPGSYSGDFWGGINPLYSSNQPDNGPFGIGWDHPVFQTAPPNPTQSHQQPQDIYSQQQQQQQQQQSQQWQQPQLQPQLVQEPQQSYGLPPHYQINQFQQPNPAYETPQPNHAPYRQYTFDPQNFYSSSPAPAQNGFSQQPAADLQRVNHPSQLAPSPARSPLPSYERPGPAPLRRDIQNDSLNLANGFQARHSSSAYHNTIDPQYLSATQHSMIQPPSSQSDFFVINPADLDSRPTPDLYQAYGTEIAPRLIGPNQSLGNIPSIPQVTAIGTAPKKAPTKVDKPPTKRKKKDEFEKAQDRAKAAAKKAMIKPGPRPADASDSSDSSDSDDSSDLEVADEPFPLPLRPQNPEGGARYDTLKAVWHPRNRQPQVSAIRNSLTLFSDLVKGVRDTWKAKSELLKAAENQNQEDKIPGIKKEVILQRRLIDLIVTTALDGGHPAIISRFGEHPIIVSALYSFLLDRHTAADSDGPLTVNILKLMSKFITMDQAMLEKTKNDKILTRFVKKGGDVIKNLAQTILSNATKFTKKKAELAKTSPNTTEKGNTLNENGLVPMHPEIVIRNPPELTPGIKRPREPDASGSPSTKRTVTPSNGKPVAKPAVTVAPKRATAPSQEAKPAAPAANTAAIKPKANMVVPKPTPSLFSSLMSASKKPGTSNAARAAAAKEKANSAPEQKPTPPPAAAPKPGFSFSETMADLNKPKEVSSSKPSEEVTPETEEERKKRLRKEERRKLRVSWKPDEELVETRLFTHDPEEELGHNDSMIRDVSDVGGEGRTLKLHRGLDDLDDEDDPEAREEVIHPYSAPIGIDFSELDPDERRRNFIKRGGTQTPESPERVAQEQREANTLSVFYTSPADIPTSPKEPPPPDPDEPYSPEVPFGEPGDGTKARSARYFAAKAPPPPPQPVQPAQSPQNSNTVDIASLLKLIQQAPQPGQQPQPQPPQNQPPNPLSDLEKTFGQLSGSQSQPPVASIPQIPQAPQPTQTPPMQGGLDIQALLAVMNAQKQLQQSAPPTFPGAQGQTPAASQPPNLASILSQFQNPAAPAGAQQQQLPAPSSSQSFGYNQNQPKGQHGNQYEESDRKRMRDGHGYSKHGHGGYDSYDDGGHGHGGYGHKRSRVNGDFKHKKHPKTGLVPCRYWREGKCLKGDDCTFRHDPLD